MPPSEIYKRGQIHVIDRVEDIHPEQWDTEIYRYKSAGTVPMTAIMDRMGSKITKSKNLNWWEQPQAQQRGDVIGVFTDSARADAYASGGTAGQTLYVTMTVSDASQLVQGHTIRIASLDVSGPGLPLEVRGVEITDDDDTYVVCKSTKADPTALFAESNLIWYIISNAQREGAELPDALMREPTKYENQTQISMGAVEMTGTELAEMERVSPEKWNRVIQDALMRLKQEEEYANIFEYMHTSYENGKERRHMQGLYEALIDPTSGEPNNVFDYRTDENFGGRSWLSGGIDFIDNIIELTSRNSEPGTKKQVFLGSQAWQSISALVRDHTHYGWATRDTEYGVVVTTLRGMTAELKLMQHPRFTENPKFRRSMLICEMKNLHNRPMQGRGLKFISGKNPDEASGYGWVDGKKAGWVRERSLSWNNLSGFAWVDGIGSANVA